MSKPGRSQEPERRLETSARRTGGGWPPAGSRAPRTGGPRARGGTGGGGPGAPGAGGGGPPAGPRAPRPGGTRAGGAPPRGAPARRARAWPAAVRDRAAAARAELATLEQGIRFRTVFLILMG